MNDDALTSEVQEGLEALQSYVREASAQLVFDEDLVVVRGSMLDVVGLHMSEIPGVAEVFDSDLEFVRGFGDAITGVTRFWRWRVWAVTVSPTNRWVPVG